MTAPVSAVHNAVSCAFTVHSIRNPVCSLSQPTDLPFGEPGSTRDAHLQSAILTTNGDRMPRFMSYWFALMACSGVFFIGLGVAQDFNDELSDELKSDSHKAVV